jgi:NAD(P)-dependent dehydrogenase (short-subunit alcohol dehydrogenase family)
MSLRNKIALITGASSGIGRGCAVAFARAGARVVVADRDADGGKVVAGEIVEAGGEALFVPVDLAVPQEVKEMVDQAVAWHGILDVLVCNAAVGGRAYGDGPVHKATVDAWDTIMDVNARGAFLACKFAIPFLLESRGNIITMASILGLVGSQQLYDTHVYMTSKAAIIGLTRNIAAYYARDGLRANCLAPGLIDTRMAQRTKRDPALWQEIAFWQPLGPLGTVEDVAEAALFLASDRAKFITGAVLPVDGGWSAQ